MGEDQLSQPFLSQPLSQLYENTLLRIPQNLNPAPPPSKTHHQRSKYNKPVKDGVISSDGARSVVVGVSYLLPCAPFEFKFSYFETPKAKPVAILKPSFLPFAPPSMARPWTEKAPMKSAQEKKIALFELVDSEGSSRVMRFETARPYRLGNYAATEVRPREEMIRKPLTRAEIRELLKPHISSNRQVNFW
ncbi:RNA-binding CRS1 / YhbY (CRM) domain-containing protein [Actinidia rufa]|uniref:RNA-binding CRS1 / YhbY (CRM) domain-containing protein n=1 Tax=Actinidia rufa TaxID=165716 RepID=A0A7J0DBN1_9ERIC|nr:RNA-binding CRS1 / YhbY (CRM) domain-containing protein [Actinidia rufa]